MSGQLAVGRGQGPGHGSVGAVPGHLVSGHTVRAASSSPCSPLPCPAAEAPASSTVQTCCVSTGRAGARGSGSCPASSRSLARAVEAIRAAGCREVPVLIGTGRVGQQRRPGGKIGCAFNDVAGHGGGRDGHLERTDAARAKFAQLGESWRASRKLGFAFVWTVNYLGWWLRWSPWWRRSWWWWSRWRWRRGRKQSAVRTVAAFLFLRFMRMRTQSGSRQALREALSP